MNAPFRIICATTPYSDKGILPPYIPYSWSMETFRTKIYGIRLRATSKKCIYRLKCLDFKIKYTSIVTYYISFIYSYISYNRDLRSVLYHSNINHFMETGTMYIHVPNFGEESCFYFYIMYICVVSYIICRNTV